VLRLRCDFQDTGCQEKKSYKIPHKTFSLPITVIKPDAAYFSAAVTIAARHNTSKLKFVNGMRLANDK